MRRKREPVDEWHVPVVNLDGEITDMSYYRMLADKELCLVTPGGNTYHTRVGCYRSWPQKYRRRFAGWRLITVAEAQSRGMRECYYCFDVEGELAYMDSPEEERYRPEALPLKTFVILCKDSQATAKDYRYGEPVAVQYDYQTQNTQLYINWVLVGALPKRMVPFYEENLGLLSMSVLSSRENENGKIEIEIGMFRKEP